MMIPDPKPARVILFSDPVSVERMLNDAPFVLVVALVVAGIRPEQHDAMRTFAARLRVPLLVQPRATYAGYGTFVKAVRSVQADRILINSYSMVLRKDLLAQVPGGAINIHGGLLPEYRGAHVTEWAIINDESEVGATIHEVDIGIDTGPVYVRRAVPIHFDDTWKEARKRTGEAIRSLIEESLADILNGRIKAKPQDPAYAQYWRRRRMEDNRVSWHMPVRDIYNLVRSQVKPHPGVLIDDGGSCTKLDEYCSIAHIAALKSAARPILGLTVDPPMQANIIADNYRLTCTLSDGRKVVVFPDWKKNCAQIEVVGSSQMQTDLALCSFLKNELGLAVK